MTLEELLEFMRKKYPQLFKMHDAGEPKMRGMLNDLLRHRLDADLNATLFTQKDQGQQRLYKQNQLIKGPDRNWDMDPNTVKQGRVM